jgi:hypothetical protein
MATGSCGRTSTSSSLDSKPGSKSFTLYASQEAVERALDLASGSGIEAGQEYWYLGRLGRLGRKPEREPWRLS